MDNALEKASAAYGTGAYDDATLEFLFPQLKESEDERIRKAIIELLKEMGRDDTGESENVKCMISYLEKQKHSLNFDAISSWLRDHVSRYVNSEYNEFHNCTEYDGTINIERLIADLKVAVDSGAFDIHEQKEQKPHLELKAGKWYICHRAFCARADHLTVKEGERFQCEKDGIVKGFVIKEPEKYFKECSAPEPMEKEQKPAWIEEDKINLNSILSHLKEYLTDGAYTYYEKWLKALPERFNLQPKAEWSEEDSKRYISIRTTLETSTVLSKEDYDANVVWLRDLVNAKKYSSPKPSWKPSKEQIKEYGYWYRNFIESGLASPTSKAVTVLGELLEQLNKLM